jgi:hypothetical protein
MAADAINPFAASVALPELPVLGDFNRDGSLSAGDIHAMLVALTDLSSYKSDRGLSDAALLLIGDLNGDDAVTNSDIQSLLNLLQSGEASVAPIPEPSTWLLSVLAAVLLSKGRLGRQTIRARPALRGASLFANCYR